MNVVRNFAFAATFVIVSALGGGEVDALAPRRGLVQQCSVQHAAQINALPDATRYRKISIIAATGTICGWTVFEDGSVIP